MTETPRSTLGEVVQRTRGDTEADDELFDGKTTD